MAAALAGLILHPELAVLAATVSQSVPGPCSEPALAVVGYSGEVCPAGQLLGRRHPESAPPFLPSISRQRAR